ncbi:MBL fold metallo-hydrolase [Microbacterium luticocti]|uniref:MBL fold metallo-hydrolase n=1 Tax=Microbacterium luticocti TaxID=451764 RepID=UPI0003FBC50F|nr:MBL fold metallo-hydrolase [Microbacterium luticocti]
MTTRLILLGTAGGPTPKVSRSAPAQAVVVDGHTYLVDAGNGVARQMALAGLPHGSLDTVLLTHHHSDHNADIGTVLLLSWAAELDRPVAVYGPPPLSAVMAAFFAQSRVDIDTRVDDEGRRALDDLVTVAEVAQPGVVHEDDRVRITAALVDHPPFGVALGYRIDTDDRSIVISGDTTPCPALIELARGADILVHEVLYEPALDWITAGSNGTRLREHLVNSHTMATDVGDVAARAGVGTLVLSHLVPSDGGVSDEQWLAAASRGFDGTIIVGRDLMEL